MNETMMQETWQPHIDAAVCTGCGDCVVVCPTGALAISNGVAVLLDPDACGYCGLCEPVCPVEAVSLPYQIVVEDSAWPIS